MEKLDKVIAGLTGCVACICSNCEYFEQGCDSACTERLMKDALAWLKEQNRLIDELSSNIPCCDNCEGKTTLGERTDKCVYEIEGFDSVIYCAKRGIENCFGYRKKIDELEAKLKESEPVVYAHWEDEYGGKYANPRYRCSACKEKSLYKMEQDMLLSWKQVQVLTERCHHCGAYMDDKEVADGLYCSE